MRIPIASLIALTCGLVLAIGVSRADPMQRPSSTSALAAKRLVTSLGTAGADRLVAVGQRGHVLFSRDAGANWMQATVPVSSDLTAVQFLDTRHGYATGHDGTVLVTTDGGANWKRVLDGQRANALALEQLQKSPASPERERLLGELQRNVEMGPDKPFLDLYFTSPQEGFVVGAYNLIFQTRDGGSTWQSWYDRTDNTAQLLNIYGIRPHQGQLFAVGEAGLLMRLDAVRQRFVRIETGYSGSFFGLLDGGSALIAYGMRGNAVISSDGGRTWSRLSSGLDASITASAKGEDGSLWLADQIGNVSVSRDGGKSFSLVKLPSSTPVASLHVTREALVLAGPRGIRRLPLPKE